MCACMCIPIVNCMECICIILNTCCSLQEHVEVLMQENVEEIGDLYFDVAEAYMETSQCQTALPILQALIKSKSFSEVGQNSCQPPFWLHDSKASSAVLPCTLLFCYLLLSHMLHQSPVYVLSSAFVSYLSSLVCCALLLYCRDLMRNTCQ